MKELKKRIPLKYIYVLSACIAILLSVGLYYTYAMFTANVSSGNVVNMDTTITYKFDINGTQNIHVGKNSVASFNVLVTNTTSGSIYYEIYYDTSNELTDVIIGEVVEDKTVTAIAPNTSGVLEKDKSITVPLVIANNSNNDIDIVVGLVSGYVGNTITYGSNNYPKGTNITNTYNLSDIKSSCEGQIGDTSNCITKIENGYKNIYCLSESNFIKEDPSGANRPVLAEGMIPITYDGTNWVKADEYGEWYSYSNKIWANAVMVTNDTRDKYMKASLGTTIPENDILAYYVWIPRYKYKLFNASYSSGTSPRVIDVVFESGTSTTGTVTCTYTSNGTESCQNKINGNWYTHPAFTLGNKNELKGIWVGKFEVSGTTSAPRIKPGVTPSLRGISIGDMYNTSKLISSTNYITTDGVNKTDSHVIKNIEWGAVAYLKQSNYGLGITDIGTNNNKNFTTGCGAQAGSDESTTCNTYNTEAGMLASTTGNIYGVYDLSGGTWEYVMGNYYGYLKNSGLSTSTLLKQHLDAYAGTSISASHLGDAMGETAGWYNDENTFIDDFYPWFVRGEGSSRGNEAGVFAFYKGYGDNVFSCGFHTVLGINE